MRAKTTRRHTQGDESKARILDAASEIAAQRGYHGTSISAVSQTSGLPVSSIYWHFDSKDDLIAAVIRRSFEAWLETSAQLARRPSGIDLRTHLIASLRAQATALAENPDFLRLGLMLALEHHPSEPTARSEFLQARQRAIELTTASLERTIIELRGTSDHDLAHKLAVLIMAAADGLFVSYQINPASMDLETGFTMLAEMIADRLDRPG
jgi:AcrR family transcriptional regulator